jgi:(4S)-4-hydroxy-5-phosphonooxypentane-2,3-dione isomerase
MERLSLIVEYETRPETLSEFVEIMRAHAKACLVEEPGCLRFEVLRPLNERGDPVANRVMANELFADQAALTHHRATPRWQALNEKFKVLLIDRRPVLSRILD